MCGNGWAIAITALAAACSVPPRREAAPPPIEILSCFDLPRGDRRSHNLSGLAWDPAARRLFAISDRDRQLVVLAPRPGFSGFDFLPSIALDIDVDPWDGEALAIAGDRFLVVADESPPAVFSVDRSGRGATQLELPDFRGTRRNRGLEGIGYVESAEGRYVFAINEQALEGDGPTSTAEHGTLVRILRHPLDGGADLEVAYLTEPIFARGAPGDHGVSDLAPLSSERVLVLERGYVAGEGNSAAVYDVDLRGAQNVAGLADARAAAPVAKRLVVDLARVPDQRCSQPPSPQRRRTLDNYEGLAVGPTLPDGRRVVFLVSDDNDHADQIPRVVTLALAPGIL